ncbi:hypothetical protein VTJ04DRAFT_4500 [Mycothermus thermophilus]|uniref:uncharacterized protein n=1 Tax=Humicola insolens TaxID=85995 RepID=UPI0037431033
MHGTDEDGNPFSFIVFLFRMVTWGMGIRFREVHIDITFGPTDEHLEDSASPVVHVLSPWGPNRYHISEHDRSKTISPEISAALKLAGIDVGSKVVWSITKGGSLFDCISVEGDFDFSPRAIPDRPDMACWYLLENSSSRTGVPPLLMTAVMLKRRQEDELKPFKCDIRIDSWVAKERGCLFERKPRKMDGGNDKIIIFDPKIAGRVGRFKKYVHRIPKIPLEKVSGVVSDQGLKIEPWWMRMRRRDEESDDEEEQETWEAAQEKEKMRRERRRRREEDSDDGEEQGIWEEAQEKKEMKRERKRRRRGGKRKRERRERRYLRHKMECEEKMKRMKRAEEERRKMEEQKNSARCLCVVM